MLVVLNIWAGGSQTMPCVFACMRMCLCVGFRVFLCFSPEEKLVGGDKKGVKPSGLYLLTGTHWIYEQDLLLAIHHWGSVGCFHFPLCLADNFRRQSVGNS